MEGRRQSMNRTGGKNDFEIKIEVKGSSGYRRSTVISISGSQHKPDVAGNIIFESLKGVVEDLGREI